MSCGEGCGREADHDRQGWSRTHLRDGASGVGVAPFPGNAFANYRYDAWGNVTASGSQQANCATGSISTTLAAAIRDRQPLRYAGYAYDSFSSLYYLSARYYDPATMQFISKDPAKADGEESAYQYCGGDPINDFDPSGNLAVNLYPQQNSGWCIPACIQMVEEFCKHKKDSQRQIHLWGTGNTNNTEMDWDQTKKALNKCGFTGYRDLEHPLTWVGTTWQINNSRPVIALNRRHAVVIYSYASKGKKHSANTYYINDPWPVKQGSRWNAADSYVTGTWGWNNSIVDLKS